MLFLASAAHAAVISVNFGDAPVNVSSNIDGVYFDFVTGAYGPSEMVGYDFNPYNNNSGLTFYGAPHRRASLPLARLAPWRKRASCSSAT